MRAGQLRHLIILQKPTTVKGSMGEELITYVDEIKNVPAFIEPLTGGEYFAAKRLQEIITIKIIIRYMTKVFDSTWRIKWGDKIYLIDTIINVNQMNKELIIMCKETK